MASLVQVTCPGCKQAGEFAREQLAAGVACPGCGRTLRIQPRKNTTTPPPQTVPTQRAALAKIPAPLPEDPEPLPEPSLVDRRQLRRRQTAARNWILLAVAVVLVAVSAAIFVPQIIASLNGSHAAHQDQIEERERSLREKQELLSHVSTDSAKPEAKDTPPTPLKETNRHTASKTRDGASDDNKTVRRPTRPGRPALGRRFRGPYPGRALLVGIKNYLYANPLNPGYRAEQSLSKDPLGLDMLHRALIEDGAFPKEQVAILSDMARADATAPTKEVLQNTIAEFLATSRAPDRIILTFVGHAVLIKEQAYLVPIEGELDKAETLVPLSWLYELLEKCPARQKLLIFDLSPHDPEVGHKRTAPENLDAKLFAQLQKLPKGTQLWLSCAAGQNSCLLASSGMQGSVFMDTLCRHAFLNRADNWALIEKHPDLEKGTLPLVLLAQHVNQKTTEYVKTRSQPAQTPMIAGAELAYNGPPAEGSPAKVVIKAPAAQGRKADDVLITSIMSEIGMPDAAKALPPFQAEAMQKFIADYENVFELENKLKDYPLRKATLAAREQIAKQEKNIRGFRRGIRANANETNFRRDIERLQQVPASVQGELEEALVLLERAGKKRDAEKSPRWQANYDFIHMLMLTKLIQVQEYNFVLGNKLRKDAPPIQDAKYNGWALVAQARLQLKESRDLAKQRDKVIEKIEKEYPDTPWAVLAKREKNTALGLDIQEAKVD